MKQPRSLRERPERDCPLPGQSYKHFLGKVYKIVCIVGLPGIARCESPLPFTAVHHESREPLQIESPRVNCLWARRQDNTWVEEELVLYRENTMGLAVTWARELESFLEVVDEGEKQFYRFEYLRPPHLSAPEHLG